MQIHEFDIFTHCRQLKFLYYIGSHMVAILCKNMNQIHQVVQKL